MSVLCFAYGSNLHPNRMRARAPSARRVVQGFVTSRQLRFHKRGLDGSGKADAVRTGNADDRVWGVVYELDRRDKARLDECESLGIGYDEAGVQVESADGCRLQRATLYEARASVIREMLPVYRWYLAYVVSGARVQGCPDWYLRRLERIASTPDPDRGRASGHWRVLRGPTAVDFTPI